MMMHILYFLLKGTGSKYQNVKKTVYTRIGSFIPKCHHLNDSMGIIRFFFLKAEVR